MHSNICCLFQFSVSSCHDWRQFSRSIQLCADLEISINQRRSGCKYIEAAAAMRLWEETRVPPAGRLTVLLSRTLGGSLCLCRGWGLGAGLAAVQWPVIGGASRFWAWHTAEETDDNPAHACLVNFLHGHLSKVKHPPQQSIDFCTWLGDIGRLVFCGPLSWGGSGIFWRHFNFKGGLFLIQMRIWVDGQPGVDAVCLF